MTHKSEIERHIDQAELDRKMKPRIAILSYHGIEKIEPRKARLISCTNVGVPKKEVEKKVSLVTVKKENPLSDLVLFLRYIFRNPGRKVSEIYKAIKLSGRRGNNVKAQAKDNDLISEKMERGSGKGRPSLRLELTGKGKEYINEKCKA